MKDRAASTTGFQKRKSVKTNQQKEILEGKSLKKLNFIRSTIKNV